MEGAKDDNNNQQQQSVFNLDNCYLSESAEIWWCSWDHLVQKYNAKFKVNNGMAELFFALLIPDQDTPNLKVNLREKNNNSNNNNTKQIYNLGIESSMLLNGNYRKFELKHNQKVSLRLKNNEEEKNFQEGEDDDDDEQNISEFFQSYLHENLVIIFWKQGYLDEEKSTLELTDCIIRSKNNKITYYADVKKLVSTSPVLYNMVKDLSLNYDHENPLDLTEIFKEFHHQHIRMYLCCVYNKNFMPKQLIHILSLLKISIKLDNQRLIKQILEVRNLGKIVRDEVVRDDPQHPCYVQNVLDFAKQYDFHQLLVFCTLILVDQSGEKTSDQMQEILQVFKKK